MDNPISRISTALSERHTDFTIAEIAAASGSTETEARTALDTLAEQGSAIALSRGLWLSAVAAGRLLATTRRVLATYHKQHPFRRWMPAREMHSLLAKAASVRHLGALLEYLEEQGVLVKSDEGRKGGGVRLPEHEVTMPLAWQNAAAILLQAYRQGDLQPPSPRDLQRGYPRDIHVPTILEILIEQGELVRVAEDLYYTPAAVDRVKDTVRKLSRENPSISVGAVRDALGSSRKYVLPLLEYLDAVGFTRRLDEQRFLVE